MSLSRVSLLGLITLVLIALATVPARAQSSNGFDDSRECSQLKDLEDDINIEDLTNGISINPDEPKYGFKRDGSYFCGENAPSYLKCKCGIASVCSEKMDPWGRNMGECGCCTTWVIILFSIFIVVILFVLIGGMYACMCHGTWMYDGYPLPVMPLLPQRSATIIAPASFPLPEQAFRPYRSNDFISSDDPAAIAAAIAAAALEPSDGLRRRNNRGAGARSARSNHSVGGATARSGDAAEPLVVPMTVVQTESGTNGVRSPALGTMSSPHTEARRPLMAGSPHSNLRSPVDDRNNRADMSNNTNGGNRPALPIPSGNTSTLNIVNNSDPLAFTPSNSDDGTRGAQQQRFTSRPNQQIPNFSVGATGSASGPVNVGAADDLEIDPSL